MEKRKIKFNAFIPKLGVMLEDVTIYGGGQIIKDYDSFVSALPENFQADTSDEAVMELVKNEERGDIEEIPVCPIYHGDDWVFIYEEDYIPLQFTGLLDKNEKEIFEWDILKIENKEMVVVWNNYFSSFTLRRQGWAFSHWFGESCDPEDCEIVGKAYEKPEMLESLTNK